MSNQYNTFGIDWHDPIADAKYDNEFKYIQVKPWAELLYLTRNMYTVWDEPRAIRLKRLLKRRGYALVTEIKHRIMVIVWISNYIHINSLRPSDTYMRQ